MGNLRRVILPLISNNLKNQEVDELTKEFNTAFNSIHDSYCQRMTINNGKLLFRVEPKNISK